MTSRAYTIFRDTVVLPEEATGPYRIGSGIAGEDDIREGAQILDHGTDAVNHLIPDYDRKPRVEAFLFAAGAQLTQVEAQLVELHRMKSLDYASGIFVDILGDIVGEPRKGRTDDEYKRYIRIRILVNRSKGKIGDLYAIALLALSGNTIVINEYYPKTIEVVALDDIGTLVPSDFIEYLKAAKPAGTQIKFGYTHEATGDTLLVSGTNFDGGDVDGTTNTGGVVAGLVG
jgi:hypothetical protein